MDNDFNKVRNASPEELVEIDGIGEVIAEAFASFFAKPENNKTIDELLKVLNLKKKK